MSEDVSTSKSVESGVEEQSQNDNLPETILEPNEVQCAKEYTTTKEPDPINPPTSGVIPVTKRNCEQRKMGTSKVCLGLLFGFGGVLLLGGILISVFWMTIYNTILFRELALTTSSSSFSMWQETPIPMYLEIYLYNWTNAEKFMNSTEKPHFVEVGPYVFREVDQKVNQTWNDNGTISYYQKRTWHFDEGLSNGSLSDKITNLNVITTTVGYSVRERSLVVRLVVDGVLRSFSETLIITKTAGELLFDGYDDPLLSFVKENDIPGVEIPFDKFGWFYDRNESVTYDGSFNMDTGNADLSRLGMIKTWNYRDHTDFWAGECGSVRGTTGEIFPPQTGDHGIEIFAPDICTTLSLERTNDTEYMGVTGYQYTSSAATLDNGTSVPSRICYCEGVECQPSGVLNVSLCRFGAPAFVSAPHFAHADPYYRGLIDGMHPDAEDYSFIMVLEPNTGVPLKVKAQLQINVLLQPIGGMSMFEGVETMYVPMLWFRQEALLTDRISRMIKFVLTLPTLGLATFIAVACIGLALTIAGTWLCVRRRWKAEDNQKLIRSDETNDRAAVE